MNEQPTCVWDKALETPIRPPTIVFGDPVRDVSDLAVMQRLMSRMESIGKFLDELGINFYTEPSDEPQEPKIDEKRDDFWGFALGDRVMVAADGAHHGLMGKVVRIGGCSISAFSESCRDFCPNVGFMATHRYLGDGKVPEEVAPGLITCPPGDLEHCD